MENILKVEFLKLKRYYIICIGVAFMLLSVLLTAFTSLADDGVVWNFVFFTEQVIKNNITLIFPMCITIITGYIISRERKDDTLKNILSIGISFRKLLLCKLVVGGTLSILFGVFSFVFTVIMSILSGYADINLSSMILAFLQIVFCNLFVYLSLLPIIVAASKAENGFLVGVIIAFVFGYATLFATGNKLLTMIYPMSAVFGLISYRSYQVEYNIILCCLSVLSMVIISLIMVVNSKNPAYNKKSTKNEKKITKRRW